MNSIVVLILGALGIGVGYGWYARNINKNVSSQYSGVEPVLTDF